MVRDLQRLLSSDRYDYVFVIKDNVVVKEAQFSPPVWAYDLGHDITIMDHFETSEGFSLDGILFRPSSMTRQFVEELLSYQNIAIGFVQNNQAAFLETILNFVGRDLDARGEPGYRDACLKHASLSQSEQTNPFIHANQLASYMTCFHSELDRLSGHHGYRKSKSVGFSSTPVWCFKQQQVPRNCFTFSSNQYRSSSSVSTMQKCQDPSFGWSHFYGGSDLQWFQHWPLRHKYSGPPKVLIYTWQTENAFQMFSNEVHWKACYAKAHGFDIIFTDILKVSGVKKYVDPDSTYGGSWYSDEMMWGWPGPLKKYLWSRKYDYVFVCGGDMLLDYLRLDYPIWAYDKGHDITIMDQNYVSYGLNENAMLMKPTAFIKEFLDAFFEFRYDWWTQGDNGPWMENILVFIGREAQAAGHIGYDNSCAEHGKLLMPSGVLLRKDKPLAESNGTRYCKCFFDQFERLAGTYGWRKSRNIGFSRTYLADDKEYLPQHTDFWSAHHVLPWVNCFTHVRSSWANWGQNCFAYHWNGDKSLTQRAVVKGTCPDPSFDWASSEWNYLNRR